MKLATLKNDTRDGCLVVVSKDLLRAVKVPHIARTLQAALDDWKNSEAELQSTYEQLNDGKLNDSFEFEPAKAAAPLPRAYQWADGSAYVNHVELVRKARGAEMPKNFWTDPLMYQGGSDAFIGCQDDVVVANEDYGIDFEAEIAVITDDLPMACTPEQALKGIRLLTLVNDVSLRNLIPNEIAKGFGFFHSKPATAFAPVVVTPEEFGDSWYDAKVHLPLVSHLNGELFGKPNAGVDMTFDFSILVAHAAKTRFLTAGTVIGSGTISNTDRSVGSSCLAEKRMLEIINDGQASTPFMKFGDKIRIEMFDKDNQTIFGAIDQKVVKY